MSDTDADLTGVVGASNSVLTGIVLGYDDGDLILVRWLHNRDRDDNAEFELFGFDPAGFPYLIERGGDSAILRREHVSHMLRRNRTMISPADLSTL